MKDILHVLATCAPGAVIQPTDHRVRVSWQGKVYYGLPTGPHGKKAGREEIEVGYVVHLVCHLGIAACAAEELPALRNKLPRSALARPQQVPLPSEAPAPGRRR
jgi:hypothetical protein